VGDAGRNLDAQLLHLALRPAARTALEPLEREHPGSAAERLFQRDLDLGTRVEAAAAKAAASRAAAEAAEPAEQRLEEIAVHPGARLGLEIEMPVRRRTELLALFPAAAELVVRGALLRIAKHLVSLVHFLEALLGVRLLADVRVVLAGEAPVRPLDVVRRRIASDAHDRVVILEFHSSSRRRCFLDDPRPSNLRAPGAALRIHRKTRAPGCS